MEDFNHKTATIGELFAIMDFSGGACEALVSHRGGGTKGQVEQDRHNLKEFAGLSHLCQEEIVERLAKAKYLNLK